MCFKVSPTRKDPKNCRVIKDDIKLQLLTEMACKIHLENNKTNACAVKKVNIKSLQYSEWRRAPYQYLTDCYAICEINQPANGRESHELNKNGPFVHRTKKQQQKNNKQTKKNSWT